MASPAKPDPPGPEDLSARLFRLADRLDDEYVCKYEAARDSRAIFTFAYVKITRTIAARILQANFRHPEWVTELAEHFAAHYVEALDAWDRSRGTVPPAWRIVFETIALKRTSVVEDLILAMTAHIVMICPFRCLKSVFPVRTENRTFTISIT